MTEPNYILHYTSYQPLSDAAPYHGGIIFETDLLETAQGAFNAVTAYQEVQTPELRRNDSKREYHVNFNSANTNEYQFWLADRNGQTLPRKTNLTNLQESTTESSATLPVYDVYYKTHCFGTRPYSKGVLLSTPVVSTAIGALEALATFRETESPNLRRRTHGEEHKVMFVQGVRPLYEFWIEVSG